MRNGERADGFALSYPIEGSSTIEFMAISINLTKYIANITMKMSSYPQTMLSPPNMIDQYKQTNNNIGHSLTVKSGPAQLLLPNRMSPSMVIMLVNSH